MGRRLDTERQNTLQPKRIQFAINEIQKLGFEVYNITTTSFQFLFKGQRVTVFPYSGWCSGKTINDCRGIDNLIKQLKNGDDL